jgi:hypothetical protein
LAGITINIPVQLPEGEINLSHATGSCITGNWTNVLRTKTAVTPVWFVTEPRMDINIYHERRPVYMLDTNVHLWPGQI